VDTSMLDTTSAPDTSESGVSPAGRRWLQLFEEGDATQRDLLGGKGANLAEMVRMGLPVPPGFTVTTEACRATTAADGVPPEGLAEEVREAVAHLEERTGLRFGDPDAPLLLSVRSGAKFSMPGMMDTVLDLGLNRDAVAGLEVRTGDRWFAFDAYRRLLELFGRVVLGVAEELLAAAATPVLEAHGVGDPSGLPVAGLEELADAYETAIEAATGVPFPADPWQQLDAAILAVFRSWNGARAVTYRRMEGISDDLGTAVNVQVMVFGNAGDDSGTGVAFTRDPATGDPEPVGDFLLHAQGEDVVAGTRTTEPLSQLADHFPECDEQLRDVFAKLEARYLDLCDIEFTIEHGELHVLQTRVGKRTALAALRIAVDLVDEGLIDERDAVGRFTPDQLEMLLHPHFDPEVSFTPLTRGLAASPGAAAGEVVLTADDAVARAEAGVDVLLVRPQTSPEDLHGLLAATGVLTSRGGLVSHAAVVARGIGKPAVCGAADLVVDPEAGTVTLGDTVVRAGDTLSIDGTTGDVVVGEVPVVAPIPPPQLDRLLGWADEVRTLKVLANADTGEDAAAAVERGAEGIGLCRTEHQFLGDRLPLVRHVILAEDEADRDAALEDLYAQQRSDFVELLRTLDGRPVTVRLLDPPLHEFLPRVEDLLVTEATEGLDDDQRRLLEGALAWREDDPMLGIRGVRLGLLRPEIYAVQVRALLDAGLELADAGGDPRVRIMIPLVSAPAELAAALAAVREVAGEVLRDRPLAYEVGAMIETPRAALLAASIAEQVDFLSFGTNDLTQMTFGFSRDDVEARLLPPYLQWGILPADPFDSLDLDGVGELVRTAVDRARSTNPTIDLSVCGEHGGDPASIGAFHRYGLDDVSCSPYRVPVARLAAAHAALGLLDTHAAST
jgi:pyruvate, orthophosphate dikinase